MHDVEGKAAVVWKKHFLRWAAAFPKEVVAYESFRGPEKEKLAKAIVIFREIVSYERRGISSWLGIGWDWEGYMKEVLDLEFALGWCLPAPLVVVVREFFVADGWFLRWFWTERERMNCLP